MLILKGKSGYDNQGQGNVPLILWIFTKEYKKIIKWYNFAKNTLLAHTLGKLLLIFLAAL